MFSNKNSETEKWKMIEEFKKEYLDLYMKEMTTLRNRYDIFSEQLEKNYENHKNSLHLQILAKLEDDFNNRFLLLEERLIRKIDAQRLKDSVN